MVRNSRENINKSAKKRNNAQYIDNLDRTWYTSEI